MDNESRLTGRLRTDVRVLDVLAEDLSHGTPYEQAVAVLLAHVATVIVNNQTEHAIFRLERIAARYPRADRVQAAREAAQVGADRAELP